jgi:hypothetical protein
MSGLNAKPWRKEPPGSAMSKYVDDCCQMSATVGARSVDPSATNDLMPQRITLHPTMPPLSLEPSGLRRLLVQRKPGPGARSERRPTRSGEDDRAGAPGQPHTAFRDLHELPDRTRGVFPSYVRVRYSEELNVAR